MKQSKIRPHNVEAERAVLGSLLIEPEAVARVRAILKPADMYLESSRKILQTCYTLVDAGTPIDLLTVAEQLTLQGELVSCGGYAYLSSLTDAVIVTSNVATYAQTVADKARCRAIMDQAEMLIAVARETEDVVRIDSSVQTLAKLSRPVVTSPLPVLASAALEQLDSMWSAAADVPDHPISWPWPRLEAIIGPLRGGKRPVLMCARSKVGKTFAALGLALCAAEQGKRVLIWELELSRASTVCRMLGIMSGVSADLIETMQGMTQEQYDRVYAAFIRLQQMPILFDASESRHANVERYDHARTCEDLMQRLDQVQQRDGQAVDLIIADYGQLIRPNKGQHGSTQRERLIYVADNLQEMAAVTGRPVVATAQLNGKGEMAHAEPSSADIQETDRFRQICSASIVLDRPYLRLTPDQQRLTPETEHYARMIVDVNQSHGLGTVLMEVDPSSGAWLERRW